MFMHHEAEKVSKWLDGWHVEPIAVAPLAMLVLAFVALAADPDSISGAFAALVVTSPVWLPVVLFIMFLRRWIHYVRFQYWFSQPMVLLHIELPPEVEKSPLAMEVILTALYNTGGETTFIARLWNGQFRATSTLELVGNGGRIGYYLHMRRGWKDFMEARIYGQYPEARITEVSDYVSEIGYSPATHDLWGTEYAKGSAAALPIRTYIDWGLDKDPDKPEKQVDPLTNILELMSAMKPGEHLWLQIVMKARKSDKDDWYGFYTGGEKFKDEAQAEIRNITEGAIKRGQELITDEDAKKRAAERSTMLLTGGEKLRVEAIERSLTKLVFDCGFRSMYIAKKEIFDGARIGAVVNLFTSFRYPGYNSLSVTRGHAIFDYPWQDWSNIRRDMIRRRMFFWYKHRAYFYVPYDQTPVLMTTEELATLWHFPSSAVKTPGLVRVPSRVGEAPTNLPTAPSNLPV
jgi:hypothetical protein